MNFNNCIRRGKKQGKKGNQAFIFFKVKEREREKKKTNPSTKEQSYQEWEETGSRK